MAFATTFLACLWKKKKKKKTSSLQSDRPSTTVDSSWSFHRDVQISMDEIQKATSNFSPDLILGGSNFGVVCKARLSSGLVVAIRNISPDAFQGYRQFHAEVETLGRLRHRNIVKILGSLASGSQRFLVHEFLERRSLDRWLYHDSNSDVAVHPLSWETRVKIIRGVADGLHYLHGLEKPIIHRNINSGNVLLDSNFEANIADFGLARMSTSSYSSAYRGYLAYHAPEIQAGVNIANPKVDVYSFGVLMLETATGRRPNLPVTIDHHYRGGKELGFVEWAKRMVVYENYVMEMVDPNIMSAGGVSEASVKEYLGIACMCCCDYQKDRPTMTEIIDLLDRVTCM